MDWIFLGCVFWVLKFVVCFEIYCCVLVLERGFFVGLGFVMYDIVFLFGVMYDSVEIGYLI